MRLFDSRAFLLTGALLASTSFPGLESALFSFGPLTFPESTKIYDRNGILLYEAYDEIRRTPIPLSDIPLTVQQATIAVEDQDFYAHNGVDVTAVIRAAVADVKAGAYTQGGSTISQQLVRNALLTKEKSLARKIKEAVLSVKMESHYTKEEILEMYLNFVPYGSNAYGIQAASQTFFRKDARDLTLMEAAYLAALPKAPSYYSPYGERRDALDARARWVLGMMERQGYVTREQARAALEEDVRFLPPSHPIRAPHFVQYVLSLLRKEYGEDAIYRQGLVVHTTLDLTLQEIAEEIVKAQVVKNEKRYNAGNAALVAIKPKNGEILAMVGSRDYFDATQDGQVNVALQPRQPGSSFKPYVYAAAFEKGMNPATMLMDVVTNFGTYGGKPYIPRNYDGREHGPVSARQALQGSLNIPAVKTLFFAGINDAISTATAMGITTLKDRERFGPSLVLGGAEVTLLDHTGAYGAFATNGIRFSPNAILDVTDNTGAVIKSSHGPMGTQAIDPGVAYQITHILSGNNARAFIFGSLARNLVLAGRPAAAKTGTTQAFHDAWTVGYTPSLVAGVWVGNSDNTPMWRGADGSVVAAPIWKAFMEKALEGTSSEAFERPSGIVELVVDATSGKLPTKYTPTFKKEIFTAFNAPTERDDVHVEKEVDGVIQVVAVYRAESWRTPLWEWAVQRWAKPPEPEDEGGE